MKKKNGFTLKQVDDILDADDVTLLANTPTQA